MSGDKRDEDGYYLYRPEPPHPRPFLYKGQLYVSRCELTYRTNLTYYMVGKYRNNGLIPETSYKYFTRFNRPNHRYLEEYVLLIERFLDEGSRFDTKKGFYEFIKNKWEIHLNELLKPIVLKQFKE